MSAPAYRLRYYVSLQSRPPGTTAGGEPLDWVEYKKAWADIRAAGGLETIKANAVASMSFGSATEAI
jgi:head-tail adaptor